MLVWQALYFTKLSLRSICIAITLKLPEIGQAWAPECYPVPIPIFDVTQVEAQTIFKGQQ